MVNLSELIKCHSSLFKLVSTLYTSFSCSLQSKCSSAKLKTQGKFLVKQDQEVTTAQSCEGEMHFYQEMDKYVLLHVLFVKSCDVGACVLSPVFVYLCIYMLSMSDRIINVHWKDKSKHFADNTETESFNFLMSKRK